MRKTTISDVADKAGVSKSTVSRVLNHADSVADDLRDRVLKAIDMLDYQPSRAARTLKKDLRDVVGFLVPSITDTIFGAVIQGAEDFAYQNDMGILANSTSDNLDRQQMYLNSLLSEPLAGLVVVPAPGTDPEMLVTMQQQGIPVVLMDRKLQGFEADYIGSDNIQGAYEAVKHLIDRGYQRIATIAGSKNVSTGVDRLTGYRMAIAESRLEIQPNWIKYGNFDEQQSYKAIQALIHQSNPPDSVFVANDAMMIGALRAIKEFNIRVPEDLALVGFDELPLADLLTPSLTTVEQSAKALGQEALRLLFDRAKSTSRAVRIVQIPTTLNIREST